MRKAMKNVSMILFTGIMVFGLAGQAFGQSVVVTPKTVVYRRAKPSAPFRKTFTITYPRISGVSTEVKKKIESILDYEKLFEFTVREERTEVEWLEDGGYKVDFNRGGVLSITLAISGAGAYPSSNVRHLNIDTKTGERISVVDEMEDGARDAMMERLNGLLTAEVAKYKKLYKSPKYDVEDVDLLFGESVGFTSENVEDFTVGGRGITFHYDYGFPHVIQALQPPGEFLLPWSELRNYIKESSVLRKPVK